MKLPVALFLLAASLAIAADAPRPSIQVVSIEAQRKITGEIGRFAPPGLKLVMQMRLANVAVVDVDPTASKVAELTDDRGTDLLDGKSIPFTIPKNKDGEAAEVMELTLRSSKLPSPEANEVRVKGSVAVLLAEGTKAVQTRDASFKAGEKVDVGPYTLIVRRPGGTVGRSLLVEITSNSMDVAGLEVSDGGTAIKVQRIGVNKLSNGDVRFAFLVARAAEKATVKVMYHAKLLRTTVPVDVKVGLGLGTAEKDGK